MTPDNRILRGIGQLVIQYTLILALSVFTEIGCSRVDGEIRDWRPADHDQGIETDPGNLQSVGRQAQNEPTASALTTTKAKSGGSVSDLADARNTWDTLCSECHGRQGQGNGPRGAGVGARNLSDPQWQRSTSDEAIAKSIASGRGQMPSFALSTEAMAKMVKLIRSFLPAN